MGKHNNTDGTVLKYNRKTVERGKIDTHNTHTHDKIMEQSLGARKPKV